MGKLDHKKEVAKLMYVKNGLTQAQISELVEVSVPTINRWAKKYEWKKYKANHLMSKVNTLQNLYEQMAQIDLAISKRPEGERYANSKEADIITKLTSSIAKLEAGTPVAIVAEVFLEASNWIHKEFGYTPMREWMLLGDKYVHHLIDKQGFKLH